MGQRVGTFGAGPAVVLPALMHALRTRQVRRRSYSLAGRRAMPYAVFME
jgi:hypothetical protein